MTSFHPLFRWSVIGGWLLMMPPVPLQTSLPPMTEWSRVSEHKSAGECERSRETMRKSARATILGDANAKATHVAAALGQLQSKCVEVKSAAPAPEPAAPAAPAAQADPDAKADSAEGDAPAAAPQKEITPPE